MDAHIARCLDDVAARSPGAARVLRAVAENYDALDAIQDELERASGGWGRACEARATDASHDAAACLQCRALAISSVLTAFNEWSGS